jgi:hypothetical protein
MSGPEAYLCSLYERVFAIFLYLMKGPQFGNRNPRYPYLEGF